MTTDKYTDDLRLDKEYEQINHPNGVTTWKTKPKEQPKALRLAEQLDSEWPEDCEVHAAADELRRLHAQEERGKKIWREDQQRMGQMQAENDRLHALNQELLTELENCVDLLAMCFSGVPVDSCIGAAIKNGNAAIAKAQGASNE